MIDWGPLQPLMDDPDIVDIYINAPDKVFVIGPDGKEFRDDVKFRDEDHVLHIVRCALEQSGRIINCEQPIVHSRIEGGFIMNVVIPPVTRRASITIYRAA